ncbi:MAG: sugar kinase [Sphingobacteriaceae bacterium]
MINKVLCFGELLLRVSPASDEEAEKHPFTLYMGGAEANTATALAGWNVPVKYCTVLPDNFMSDYIVNYLEYRGIFTSSIHRAGKRVGVYYLDRGADLKSSVVYDREGSSFSDLKRGVIDWDKVLRDVSWFNFTAISPALNANVAEVCLEALEAATRKNIPISLDLNYRSRLWKYGKEPLEVMPELAEHCDLIMGNIWAANTLLNTPIDNNIHQKGKTEDYLQHALATSEEIIKRFPKCKHVANTFRFDEDSDNLLYYTSLYTGGKQYNSEQFRTKGVIDRSGSGDCFMAGLIYGFYNNHASQDIVNYATAAAFGKLQEQGDSTRQDILTVTKLRTDNE